jgi:hypothetical protein
MLHGHRLAVTLLLAVAAVSFIGLDVFGQAKDKKDKKDKAEDPTKKVTLAWKFKKDKPFYQEMTTKTKQKMTVMNNDVTQTQEQTFYFSWTPKSLKDDKWIIEQQILGVKMNIDIGGSPIKYDSTSQAANNNNPLSEFFKALVDAKFTLTIDPKTLKITKIEGREEFLKRLSDANKQMAPLLNQILSEKALIEMAEPTFAVISQKPVEKDTTWKKTTVLDMGPIGKYENEYTYTYGGEEKKLDKIDVKTKLKYSPPTKADGIGGLPFKITSAELKSDDKDSKGTVWFDREKGRVEKSTMSLKLEGTLKIEIGGQPTDVTLSQEQTTEVKTSDDNPLKKDKDKSATK